MASPNTIADCLARLAGNYQCSQNWVQANVKNWSDAFSSVDDKVLLEAVRDWMVTGTKAPTMIEMREAVRHAAPRPSLASTSSPSCRRCRGEGRVPVLVLHRLPEPGVAVPHDEYLVGCSCPLGTRYHQAHGQIDGLSKRWMERGAFIVEWPSPAERYEAQGHQRVVPSVQARRQARATVRAFGG
jgi:hypothetical protein